ncbi:protein CUSTOS [Fundulus diaphanus]
MASRAERMANVSKDSSSSSDDEELSRCREAVWESQTNKAGGGEDGVKQESKRVVVADHDHDGNELQVTQGFRKHVAKKLERLLDSCISETKPVALKCLEPKCEEDDDEGFHLFSTSVPGQEAAKPPSPARCRPAPSSSDSDSEMETQLREAAVSISDLFPPSMHSSSSGEPAGSEVGAKKKDEEEEHYVVKKQIKEDKRQDSVRSAHCQSNGEQELSVVDIKRKKKNKHKNKIKKQKL